MIPMALTGQGAMGITHPAERPEIATRPDGEGAAGSGTGQG